MPRPRGNDAGTVELLYQPYQQALLRAIDQRTGDGRWAFDRLSVFAGRRGGKTHVGGLAAVKLAGRPQTTGWVCAPTYDDLHDFVMPAFFRCLPESWIAEWSGEHRTLTLKNRTQVAFRSLDDPERARGPGLDWAWIDEARKIQEQAWLTMQPALADKQGQAIFTTSPNGYDWCYRRLWVPAQQGEPGYWACRYKTAQNPAIPHWVLEKARRELPPLLFKQEYEADFVTFAGAVYGPAVQPCLLTEDDAVRRVLPEWPEIKPTRPSLMGIDPGADHPFAAVLIVAVPAGLVVVGEYLARNRPLVEHVRAIQTLLAARTPGSTLEPSVIAVDKTQRQWIVELAHHGLGCAPAENWVSPGIQRVHRWLASGQFWIVESACPKLIEQLQNYQWIEDATFKDGSLRREQVRKVDDDLPDALRYALSLWPDLPEMPETGSRRLVPESAAWTVDRLQRIAAAERGELDEETPGLLEDAVLEETGIGPLGEFWM
jgi:hypothetical protein